MLHILSSALVLYSSRYLCHDCSLSCRMPVPPPLFPSLSRFTLSLFLHSSLPFHFYPPSLTLCLPFTILSPPLSTSLYSHLSPPVFPSVTLPLPVFRSTFFLLPLTLTPLHTIFSTPPPHASTGVSLASRHLPGGLAVEHHHHGQLHEQVQPPVLVPVAAQTHGVEPPRGLVPPQADR